MSDRRQMTIVAVVAMVVTIGFFVVGIKPTMSEISKTQTEVSAAKEQEQTLRNQILRLEEIRRNAPAMTARLAAVSQYLPSTPDLPSFIRLTQGAASQSGVDLQSIAPSPPSDLSDAKGIQVINVTLVIEAGFHRVEDFLARLENLKRIVLVQSLSMSPQIDPLSGKTLLQGTLALQMYIVQPNATIGTTTTTPDVSATPSPGGNT